MENVFFLGSTKRTIESKDYYRITVLDINNCQLFHFYKLVDNKSTQFVNSHKRFEDISNYLTFVIKRNNKISFDIK